MLHEEYERGDDGDKNVGWKKTPKEKRRICSIINACAKNHA
jgi:hypothetical protein